MELDPQVKEMMVRARASGRKSICTMSPPDARVAYEERYRALAPARIELARVEDRELPGGAGPIAARIYSPAPAGSASDLPILVYFHGGGFVVGSIEAYDTQSRAIAAAAQCIVVTPEFRLAPEHPFPAAVEDAFAITRYVANNARALGGDPARVAVGGDSAGGNLSAVVCQLAKQAGGPEIAFQLLLYPSVDYRPPEEARYESVELFAEGYFLDRVMRDWFRGLYFKDLSDSHDVRASPILAEDLSGLPPALVVTAAFDPLRDIGKAYADRLRQAGVVTEYRCYEGMIHNFFCQAGAFDVPRRALQETCDALRSALAAPADTRPAISGARSVGPAQ